MRHYVLGLVDTDEAAQEITRRVTGAGFAKEEIYVLTSARESGKAGERGSLNKGVGLLAGIGPAVFGGAGHFVGTGRIKDASSSGEIGAEEGGAAAFLGRFGLSGPRSDSTRRSWRKAEFSLPCKSANRKRRPSLERSSKTRAARKSQRCRLKKSREKAELSTFLGMLSRRDSAR